jgi:hypothetical protein
LDEAIRRTVNHTIGKNLISVFLPNNHIHQGVAARFSFWDERVQRY